MKEKGISYILTWHLQSDVIEKRFGWYRQSNGGLYHIGVYPILNAEKKIRIKCLLQHSKFSMAEEKRLCKNNDTQNGENIERDSAILLNALTTDYEEKIDNSDTGVIYYVAGFTSKSLMRREKCEECINLMVEERKDRPILLSEEDTEKSDAEKRSEASFLKMINRGGLCKPSDITFMTCVHAWHHFQQIMSQKKSLFMSLDHPRDVFVHSFINKLKSIEDGKLIIDTTCKEEHIYLNIMKKVAIKFFNSMGKSFTADTNSKIHEGMKRKVVQDNVKGKSGTKRKIAKLQSS